MSRFTSYGPGDHQTWGDTSHNPSSPAYVEPPPTVCECCERDDHNTPDIEWSAHPWWSGMTLCTDCERFEDNMSEWVRLTLMGANEEGDKLHSEWLQMSSDLQQIAHAHVRNTQLLTTILQARFIKPHNQGGTQCNS